MSAPVLVCPDCGQSYGANPGHCRGGRFGGCCKSFQTTGCFDVHRVGDASKGERRCLTSDEMRAAGWDVDSRTGRWVSPKAVRDRLRVRPDWQSLRGAPR